MRVGLPGKIKHLQLGNCVEHGFTYIEDSFVLALFARFHFHVVKAIFLGFRTRHFCFWDRPSRLVVVRKRFELAPRCVTTDRGGRSVQKKRPYQRQRRYKHAGYSLCPSSAVEPPPSAAPSALR